MTKRTLTIGIAVLALTSFSRNALADGAYQGTMSNIAADSSFPSFFVFSVNGQNSQICNGQPVTGNVYAGVADAVKATYALLLAAQISQRQVLITYTCRTDQWVQVTRVQLL